MDVSVPLSGLLFLNIFLQALYLSLFHGFRPLIGVIISKRKKKMSGNKKVDVSFRPLIGVIISKQERFVNMHLHLVLVSVPLSGLLFLNDDEKIRQN